MASGDLIMKLLLNSSDFDGKIGKAGKKVEEFSSVGTKAFKGMTSMLTKLAGVAGVAVTGFEIFNKAIASSQPLTDMYGRSMEVMTTSLDNFLYSIANADFSSFNAGLETMAQNARAMYDAYDQLANTLMSARFATSLDRTKYHELMSTARNKSLPIDERQRALDEAKNIGAQIQATAKKVEADSYAALQAMFAAKTGTDASLFTPAMMEEAFRLDITSTAEEERKRIEEQFKAYKQEMKRAENVSVNAGAAFKKQYGYTYDWRVADDKDKERYTEIFAKEKENISARKKLIQDKYAEVITKQLALFRLRDEDLQKAMDTYENAVSQRTVAAEISTSTNEVQASILTQQAAIEKAAQKDAEAFAKARAELKALREDVEKPLHHKAPEMLGVDVTREKLPEKLEPVKMEDPWEKLQIKKITEQGEDFEKITTSVDLLSASFGKLNDSIGGSASSLLAFAENSLGAINSIVALIAYIQEEKRQHDANASATMKEAAAKTLSSYAGIPLAGLSLGMAAVAALVGVFQSLPFFANGGVVTSATLGVFGEAGPEAVLPLNRINDYINTKDVHVTGQIVGRGKDLAVLIDNYNKVRSVK